jgi:hypothetical protein
VRGEEERLMMGWLGVVDEEMGEAEELEGW